MPAGPQILRFQRGLPTSRQFGERLRLLVIEGNEKGVCYSLLGDLIFIGREDSQITLNDTNISRKHAELSWKGSQYQIRDLGSSNGIVVNGQKVPEANLKAGDILMVGLTALEVYGVTQSSKNANPHFAGPPKKIKLDEPQKELGTSAEKKKKNDLARKRLIIYALLFFVAYFVFFSEEDKVQTFRERGKIEPSEEDAPKKKVSKKDIKDAIAEYVPDYTLDTQQRKDAEVFFRSGVREIQNKNYRRAMTAFETALTVDPTHDLAKIYLKSAKKDMEADVKSTFAAAVRARKSLRFKEARMHYENIIRYLEGNAENRLDETKPTEDAAKKSQEKKDRTMAEYYKDAQEALVQLEKEENRIR